MSLINMHDLVLRSKANGPGTRMVVWVQGCSRRCPGCFNPETQAFKGKKLIAVDDLINKALMQEVDGITFSGGEPFGQAEALAELAQRLREHGLTVVCYTGYTLEELRAGNHADWTALLDQVDLLIDGPFIQEQKCSEPYRGSANQKLHFLTGRIRPEEVEGNRQTAEFNLGADGTVMETGFPELPGMDATMQEVSEILGKKKED